MKQKAFYGLILLAAIYGSLVIGMYFYQSRLQFDPDPERVSPGAVNLSNVAELSLKTPDHETLVAWYTKPTAGMPTILFLHGKGGGNANRAMRYAYYTSKGYGLLLPSYRGYGGSSGIPSAGGLGIDAETAYDWLAAQGVAPNDILLVGESMGAGLATILAAKRAVGALALEAPYSSIADVAADRYWWLPVRLLIKGDINALAAISDVHVPILMQHGEADASIPIGFGRKLFSAANEPKEFVAIPGGTHAIFNQPTWQLETEFFERIRKSY